MKYRSGTVGGLRRARKNIFFFLLGFGFLSVQRAGFLWELNSAQKFASLVTMVCTAAAFVCAIRQFFEFALEVGPNNIRISDPAVEAKQRISISSIENLYLSSGRNDHQYRLEVETTDGGGTSIMFRSRQDFQIVVRSIGQFYPEITPR